MANITKRGDTYRITVSSGYGVDGKQIRHTMTWKPPHDMTEKQAKKELERQAVLFEDKIRSGQYINSSIKLAEFCDIWLKQYAQTQLKPKTIKNYTDCMQRINAALGHIPINRLQPQHLIEFYEQLAAEGVRGDTKYKPIVDLRQLLKSKKTTQRSICEVSGLSVGTVRSAVNGNAVSRSTAESIAAALGLPFSNLFSVTGNLKKLSGTTALYYHRVISSMLQTAVYWQIIPYNPCSRVKPPKAERKEAKSLDEEQAAALLEALELEPLIYRTLYTVILYSGMRRGEACGLEWADIDFDNEIIDINKSSVYLPGKGVFDNDTKTEASHRVIRLPQSVFVLLKEHRSNQSIERLKLGDKWQNSNKVFTSWDGAPIHPDTVSDWFRAFVQRRNLPPITVHGLRHTNASLLIANGTNIKTVSKRLGHANTTTTVNIYTHAIQTADEMAADVLNDILTPKKNAKQA